MHILDLLRIAEATIAEHPDATIDSIDDQLFLSMPEPQRHNGCRVRLFRRRGPYAVIVSGVRGRLTVYVSARRVRDYLKEVHNVS
jgi:hypothetical protein